MAEAIVLTAPQKMAFMQMKGNAGRISMEDRYSDLKKSGLPQEVIGAFTDLSMKTAKTVTGEAIDIGKIIIDEIIKFIKANPNMAVGALIGAAIGSLTSLIPFIGPLIAPIGIAAGAMAGAIVGHRIDKKNKGEELSDGIIGIAEDIFTLAKEFFNMLVSIVKTYIDSKSMQ